jgi:hypothetical protein
VPPLEQRAYKQRFAKAITLSIFTELTLEHSPSERRLDFMIQAVYQSKPRANGQVIDRPILKTSLPAEEPRSIHWLGTAPGRVEGIEFPCMVMSHLRGQWSVGSHTVDVYINADKVGSGSFEIYE